MTITVLCAVVLRYCPPPGGGGGGVGGLPYKLDGVIVIGVIEREP